MRIPFFVLLMSLFYLTNGAQAQEKWFNGPHFGVTLSAEHVIGGSFIDGVDVLSEATKPVFSLSGGYRFQLKNGVVLGLGGKVGWLDGDLSMSDSDQSLTVNYSNKSPWSC